MNSRSLPKRLLAVAVLALLLCGLRTSAQYVGSATTTSPTANVLNTATEILGSGGGSGTFSYKGGGNAVDAAVATALSACVVNPANASLGAYGGHMLIYKSGFDGDTPLITCINFDSAAGSLANSNMFVGSVDPVTGNWTNGSAANLLGWKAAGVPGAFAGLWMAQTNYGRKVNGTNYLPFTEVLKPALARIASGAAASTAYYTLSSLSNLVMDLYTNSDPYAVFYSGDIAQDIVTAMQANGGLVTYADMTNYRPREVTPYSRHFNCPNGTPATVYVAPPGSSGLSALQEVAFVEALGWTNGPTGTWDTLHYWHGRAEAARMMWKDHFQWLGDPWGGVLPPDFLGNGSTNFCDQFLAHATNGFASSPAWDANEIQLTNSVSNTIVQAVNSETNVPIRVHWNDIRYGTRNITVCDQWGNCVAMTFSMGGGYGAQVGVTNRGLVFGQGMSLFDPRPGWPNSIGPGKRQVDNMCPAIVVPDNQTTGRPPFAVGAAGGSTIENNMAAQLIKYLMDEPTSRASNPSTWIYNFEANNIIYMRPSFPSGVQTYLSTVGLSAPGSPPSSGELTYVEAFIPPTVTQQPQSTNIASGDSAAFSVTATGLPLFYQWLQNGVALADGANVSGALTSNLTVNAITNSSAFTVVVSNGSGSVTSAPANVIIQGPPTISAQPVSRTNVVTTTAIFSIGAVGPAPLSFQWRRNSTNLTNSGNISGVTATNLTISSAAFADSATYSCVVSNSYGAVTSQNVALTVVDPPASLSLLWSVGPNDGQPWFNLSGSTSVPNQRTIAYNSLSNHLYVVSRSSSTTSNYTIYVLNATNGSFLYTLKTNGIQNTVSKSGIGLVGICCADDGSIYACNESNDSWGEGGADTAAYFRIYRWANANSNTLPTLVYYGDPAGTTSPLRWGDCLSVRGTGTNTQLTVSMTYFNSYTTTSGSVGYAAILTPSNSILTNFTPKWFSTVNYATTVGRSIEFDGNNNAVWQKNPDTGVYKNSFDPTNSLGGTQIFSSNILIAANFPVGLMGVGIETTRHLAGGVFANSTTADTLNLYDITDVNDPTLLVQYAFPTSPRVANNNQISQTFFKNGMAFSIDANNGIMVFKIMDPVIPQITSQPSSRTNLVGTAATFAVSAAGVAPLSYQWLKNGANLSDTSNIAGSTTNQLNITSADVADAGTYSVVVSNANGSVTSSAATLTVTQSASGQLVLYEPFNYSNIGQPVSSNTPANWTYNGSGANDLNVTSGSLTYPGLVASAGNSVTNGGDGLGVRRLLGTNISSGRFYFSALFRINDLGFGAWSGSGSQVGALTSTDNVSFRLTLIVKSNSPNGYVIGLQKGGTGAVTTFDTTERKAGDTVLLVGKYDFTVTPNVVSLWVNPSASSLGGPAEPSALVTSSTGTDNLVIDRFNMRQNAATGSSSVPANMQWDELRFGYTWWDVTPPSAPTIVSQPSDRTCDPGSTATFSVAATGNFVSYQWQHNGVPFGDGANVAGSATSSLTLSPVGGTDAGTYAVLVSNASGSVLSSNAVLIVTNLVPHLQAINSTASNNYSLTWSVNAGSTYHFQYKNDLSDSVWQDITDATAGSSVLTLADSTTNSQRFYLLATDSGSGDVGGFIKLSLPGNSDSIVALPFTRPPAASATISTVSSNTVTAVVSPGWSPNQFVYSAGAQTNTYYARIDSGAQAGWIFPITANSTNAVQLDTSIAPLSATAGDFFSIVPYWTLASAFANTNGIFASPTPGNRLTEILIQDSVSAGINLSSTKIYFLNSGIWKLVGDGSANHNDDILPPFAHFIIRQNTNANATLLTSGEVISTPLSIVLRATATSKQDNYVALPRAQTISLANSQLISSGAFSASPLAGTRTDELLTFDNNSATKNKSAAAIYFYWSNAWRQVGLGNADVSSSNVVVPGVGFIIRKNTNASPSIWTNSP